MISMYTHHGVMLSYYSAKTRAYLSYKRIPFVERYDGNDLSSRIRAVTHKVMVPVVETPDGEILQDTTVIIDELESRHADRPVLPVDPVMLLICRIVEFVIDELWISTAMNSRWNDPVSKAFVVSEFGNRIGRSFGLEGDEAMRVGERVAERMQSFLPWLGISDDRGRKAASQFFESATHALNSVVSPTDFAFGARPTLLDLCLFTGYYAHQYRDPGAAQQFMKLEAPGLCYFLDNLHAGQCLPDAGDLAIDEPLLNYLSVIGPAGAQFAEGTAAGTRTLAAEATIDAPFEALVDPFPVNLLGHELTRGSSVFSAWKAQRVRDAYDAMADTNRFRADPIIDRIGWQPFLAADPGYRLIRRDHRIVLEALS